MAKRRARPLQRRLDIPRLSKNALRRAVVGLLKVASLWERGYIAHACRPARQAHTEMLNEFLNVAHDHWCKVPIGRADGGYNINVGDHYIARLREVIARDLRDNSVPIAERKRHFQEMVWWFWPSDTPPRFDVAWKKLVKSRWGVAQTVETTRKSVAGRAAASAASDFVRNLGGRSTSQLEKIRATMWPPPKNSGYSSSEIHERASCAGPFVAETQWMRYALELAGYSRRAVEEIQGEFGRFEILTKGREFDDGKGPVSMEGPVRVRTRRSRTADAALQKVRGG